MLNPYITFGLCAAVIIFCGIRLSRYGDLIAEKSGLGKAWLGLIMMSSVTSLPELISGISAVTFINAPNLAIGDVVGSCMFNLLIFALLDVFYKQAPISSRVQQSQVIAAGFSVIIIGLVSAGLIFEKYIPVLGWLSLSSIGFVLVYLIAIRTMYTYETKRNKTADVEETHTDGVSLKLAIGYYVLNAFFVIVAAIFLPHAGEQIAEQTGLGQSFVGTLLIAASTSLPELVVSISAIRIGSVDMAVGNLFGSNLFNILILAIDDSFYSHGSLLAASSPGNLITLFAVLIMTGIAIVGLVFRQEKKRWAMGWDTFAIALVYLTGVSLLYLARGL
jgi:cation:H+ antiporter